jgi:hypothetical protein
MPDQFRRKPFSHRTHLDLCWQLSCRAWAAWLLGRQQVGLQARGRGAPAGLASVSSWQLLCGRWGPPGVLCLHGLESAACCLLCGCHWRGLRLVQSCHPQARLHARLALAAPQQQGLVLQVATAGIKLTWPGSVEHATSIADKVQRPACLSHAKLISMCWVMSHYP